MRDTKVVNHSDAAPVDIDRLRRRITPRRVTVAIAAVILYWWIFADTEISIRDFIDGFPAMGKLFGMMFPPDWSTMTRFIRPAIETFQIGVTATLLGAILAIPTAFLGARNLSPHPLVCSITRTVLAVFRGVSEIVWALIFVVAVGLGPFAGVLALAMFTIGMIGKLLSEAVEAVDPGPLEALRAAGASEWRVFVYGAWPQILPTFISYSLYYWDSNTRQATVVGFVGAGGLGYTLFTSINAYRFEQATTALILMVLIIVTIDRFCLFLRRRLDR